MFDLDRFIADLRATLPEKSRQPMKDVVALEKSILVALEDDLMTADERLAQTFECMTGWVAMDEPPPTATDWAA